MRAVDTNVLVRLITRDDPRQAVIRSRLSLGFSDCLILQLARRAGHQPLGTFDRTLGRVEGAQKL